MYVRSCMADYQLCKIHRKQIQREWERYVKIIVIMKQISLLDQEALEMFTGMLKNWL